MSAPQRTNKVFEALGIKPGPPPDGDKTEADTEPPTTAAPENGGLPSATEFKSPGAQPGRMSATPEPTVEIQLDDQSQMLAAEEFCQKLGLEYFAAAIVLLAVRHELGGGMADLKLLTQRAKRLAFLKYGESI